MALQQTLYIRIYRNRITIQDVESQAISSVDAVSPFTTDRLLVGQFSTAVETLQKAIRQIHTGWRALLIRPIILIQPLEMIEGSLSEVEERIFKELAASAKANRIVVWTGPELSPQQVMEQTKNAR
ncbi:1-pyrroline-5-carboxylate dehydrogenase [endosymbiont of Riftia pachyptila]|uniref:Rod shape-determining protein MreB n=1 Tax=endosymbiont of Riftia pachyptila (vent Ph05) TaxID=1048808 RepID=G2DBZ1_9GAMM|nr:1-pyrroline-5-carboxylate dehydrogenase [endosymbiont of Riftia pachyptila]EGV51880.1 hypothetical protein Rifp1Sym_aw00280 [endosymbiont of Riftia pachyptila (vent Ph05)]